jgi:hypothetical protein
MKNYVGSILTKLVIIIACVAVIPSDAFNQDKGAKTVKSGSGSRNKSKRLSNSYNARKRSGKKHWNNQDKETRKRMKRAAKNAKRRQQGKPMKSNRLV